MKRWEIPFVKCLWPVPCLKSRMFSTTSPSPSVMCWPDFSLQISLGREVTLCNIRLTKCHLNKTLIGLGMKCSKPYLFYIFIHCNIKSETWLTCMSRIYIYAWTHMSENKIYTRILYIGDFLLPARLSYLIKSNSIPSVSSITTSW